MAGEALVKRYLPVALSLLTPFEAPGPGSSVIVAWYLRSQSEHVRRCSVLPNVS